MVLYQICVFGVDRKFNMAARANNADLFTTTFLTYLLHFFTVNYAQRLNLTILCLNKHRFFIRLYHKIRNIELTQ